MGAYDRASDALHAMRALATAGGATTQTVELLRALEAHLGQPQTPSPTEVPAGPSPRLSPSSPQAAGAAAEEPGAAAAEPWVDIQRSQAV